LEIASAFNVLGFATQMPAVLDAAVTVAASDGFRMAIVYVHLIACCVAIGLVLTSDISFVSRLLKGSREPESALHAEPKPQAAHLAFLQKTVSIALALLWLTGIAIVSRDAALAGWEYFLNPKIQAKIVIVCLLTLNGLVLHNAVLPALKAAGSVLHLPLGRRTLALLAGSISGVSWFYAAMLGIGRPLNWNYALTELLVMYPALIAAAFLGMVFLCAIARYRGGAAQLASA